MIRGRITQLRRPERDDIDRWLVWFNDPEVTRGLSVYLPMSRDDEERFYEQGRESKSMVLLAIETLEGRHIGTIGLHAIDWKNRHAELGIAIGEKDCWDKGYGSDAICALLRFAFGEMNLNRVYLRVVEFNKRAIACYEKVGFRHEGRHRQEIFQEGQYFDHLLMGILRDELEGDEP